jgi:hypothetical protein
MAILVSLLDWRPFRRGTLRGFITAELRSGLIIHEISVFAMNGKAQCALPSKPLLDREGRAVLDASGKRRYAEIIAFSSKETRDHFSAAIIAALLAAHPEALAGD